MIKYTNSEIVFEEIPDYISLAINISNCQNRCIGCHSQYLQQNIGTELNENEIDKLVDKNYGINCIVFMGEGNDRVALLHLAQYIKEKYKDLKLAIYSGRSNVEEEYDKLFNFIKTGAYIEEKGPLNKNTTNQRLYKIENGKRIDITSVFWR